MITPLIPVVTVTGYRKLKNTYIVKFQAKIGPLQVTIAALDDQNSNSSDLHGNQIIFKALWRLTYTLIRQNVARR